MDLLAQLEQHPCYEQHIVSIKNIYETQLISLMCPLMYNGICSLYSLALKLEKQNKNNGSSLKLFLKTLHDIPNLNSHKIRQEYNRIKMESQNAEIFDDLIMAVIKSNVILLTYNHDKKRKNLIETKYHENIMPHEFVHACYINIARVIINNPNLVLHSYNSNNPAFASKIQQRCLNAITKTIRTTIVSMLPMKEILADYLLKYNHSQENDINVNIQHNKNQLQSLLNDDSDLNAFVEEPNFVYKVQNQSVSPNYTNDNAQKTNNIPQLDNTIKTNNVPKLDNTLQINNEQMTMETNDHKTMHNPDKIIPPNNTKIIGIQMNKKTENLIAP